MKRVPYGSSWGWPLGLACIFLVGAGCASPLNSSSGELGELYMESLRAYSAGDLAKAEYGLEEITERVPSESQAWFKLGNIYAQTQRPRLAVEAYQEALLRNPDLGKAWYNMGVVQLRQAANSFVSLTRHVPETDPLNPLASELAEKTMGVLGRVPAPQPVIDEAEQVKREGATAMAESAEPPAASP